MIGERFCNRILRDLKQSIAKGPKLEQRISDDALKALPGDRIEHWTTHDQTEKKWSTVKVVGWIFPPQGGRIYSYETTDNELIPNDHVLQVEKMQVAPSLKQPAGENVERYEVLEFKDQIRASTCLSWEMKMAVNCIFDGSIEDLKIARLLVNKQIKALEQLDRLVKEMNLNP